MDEAASAARLVANDLPSGPPSRADQGDLASCVDRTYRPLSRHFQNHRMHATFCREEAAVAAQSGRSDGEPASPASAMGARDRRSTHCR
jgi:hypothetical protein